jgi:hypothetical protein
MSLSSSATALVLGLVDLHVRLHELIGRNKHSHFALLWTVHQTTSDATDASDALLLVADVEADAPRRPRDGKFIIVA